MVSRVVMVLSVMMSGVVSSVVVGNGVLCCGEW